MKSRCTHSRIICVDVCSPNWSLLGQNFWKKKKYNIWIIYQRTLRILGKIQIKFCQSISDKNYFFFHSKNVKFFNQSFRQLSSCAFGQQTNVSEGSLLGRFFLEHKALELIILYAGVSQLMSLYCFVGNGHLNGRLSEMADCPSTYATSEMNKKIKTKKSFYSREG